jgi:hypothetical protein
MDQIKVDIRDLDLLDISQQSVPLSGLRRRNKVASEPRTLIKSSLELAEPFDRRLQIILKTVNVSESSLRSFILPPAKIPIGTAGVTPTATPTITPVTVALAAEFNIFYFVGISEQYGLYACGKPIGEVGTFASAGVGVWTNSGLVCWADYYIHFWAACRSGRSIGRNWRRRRPVGCGRSIVG